MIKLKETNVRLSRGYWKKVASLLPHSLFFIILLRFHATQLQQILYIRIAKKGPIADNIIITIIAIVIILFIFFLSLSYFSFSTFLSPLENFYVLIFSFCIVLFWFSSCSIIVILYTNSPFSSSDAMSRFTWYLLLFLTL